MFSGFIYKKRSKSFVQVILGYFIAIVYCLYAGYICITWTRMSGDDFFLVLVFRHFRGSNRERNREDDRVIERKTERKRAMNKLKQLAVV